MMVALALAATLLVAAVPVGLAPVASVTSMAAVGALLVGLGLGLGWRWPVSAAACLLVADYAAALWLVDAPADIVAAAGFGLAVLFVLEASDLAGRARGAAVRAGIVRATLVRTAAVGAATLATVTVCAALVTSLASALPPLATPWLAAAAGLAILGIVAAILVRSP